MINTVTNPLTFTVPLSYEAHSVAQQCREGIVNPDKSKQVYLNSLAVYAVNYYLQGMGLETDWENSDSRDFMAVKLANIADLSLKHLGKVECCYILPNEDHFEIAPEVTEDRIAYIAVKLTKSLKEATILGYIQTPTSTVFINQLQSLEDLLLYLSTLEVEALSPSEIKTSTISELDTANTSEIEFISYVATTQKEVNLPQGKTPPLVSRLGSWLEGVVEEGWQRVEELFSSQQLGLAFMNEVSVIRAQELDLGIQLNQISVALVTKVTTPETSDTSEVDILMQIRPMRETTLPAGISLQIQDTSGETVLETTSRTGDNWIQLAFSAEYGETFQVVVRYQDAVLTRNFVI
jgi:hypothetical protein